MYEEKKRFNTMGTQAWLRAFNGLDLLVFLPQAIFHQQAKKGNVIAAKRFVMMTEWGANIGGWLTSIG